MAQKIVTTVYKSKLEDGGIFRGETRRDGEDRGRGALEIEEDGIGELENVVSEQSWSSFSIS